MSCDWRKIEHRVTAEAEKIQGFQQQEVEGIEDFYPELKNRGGPSPDWASMADLPLLACVLTAPHTLVDLYDWNSEEELIEKYGVDLRFLLELRDENHITLLANLPPERYKKELCTWLYPLLSDERTIWRSLRTPSYFDSLCEDLSGRRTKMEEKIKQVFKRFSHSRIEALCRSIQTTHLPDSSDSLARVLSIWYSYIYPQDQAAAESVWNDFTNKPELTMPEIRQLYLMYAPTQTAALGGTLRMTGDKILSYFDKDISLNELPENATEARAIHEYLLNIEFEKLGLRAEDLNYAKYWHSMSEGMRSRILRILRDDRERSELLTTERNLRSLLYRKGDVPATLERVEKYVERLMEYYNFLKGVGNVAFGTTCIALIANRTILPKSMQIPEDLLVYLSVARMLPYIDSVLRRVPSRTVEALVDQLQVVRFVRQLAAT
jgi:hypothetical protein